MTARQRVDVKWKDLRLAARTSGANYGEDEQKVGDVVRKLSGELTPSSLPTLVWIYRPDDDEINEKIESSLFQNEMIGLALKRFHTYRANVETISREEVVKDCGKTPSFRFYNPAGKLLLKLEGRSVTSLARFTKAVELAWAKTYTGALRKYTKEMTKILDRLDKVARDKAQVEQRLGKLAEKPNPRKQQMLERELAAIEKREATIAEDEKKILAKLVLRDEFLPKDDQKTAGK